MTTALANNTALIPASNFEGRKLNGVKFSAGSAYFTQNGWGIWDKAADAWVCMNGSVKVGGVEYPAPYCLTRKKHVKSAFEAGLWNGYTTVKAKAA